MPIRLVFVDVYADPYDFIRSVTNHCDIHVYTSLVCSPIGLEIRPPIQNTLDCCNKYTDARKSRVFCSKKTRVYTSFVCSPIRLGIRPPTQNTPKRYNKYADARKSRIFAAETRVYTSFVCSPIRLGIRPPIKNALERCKKYTDARKSRVFAAKTRDFRASVYFLQRSSAFFNGGRISPGSQVLLGTLPNQTSVHKGSENV